MASDDQDLLQQGVYDQLLTSQLASRIARAGMRPETEHIDEAEQPSVLARGLAQLLEKELGSLKSGQRRVELFNRVSAELGMGEHALPPEPRRLTVLRAPAQAGVEQFPAEQTTLPWGEPALLTNSHGDPHLASELYKELRTADRVDLLCAFIKWHGIRTLVEPLNAMHRRGVPLRVITSTYLGSTDRTALDRLINEYGAQVKVHYEIERTRLHAKAWLFTRQSRFDTAYVGSSNLTNTALVDGVEWNVRLARSATPTLIKKFGATFEAYWNDPSFETYTPSTDAERLDQALLEARGGGVEGRETITLSGLEVRPYPHQQRILEDLDVERLVHDRHRNLVVAATGTGKTVVAALDYRRLCEEAGRRLKLLFVAHRQEILEQARRKYAEVLLDGDFGELFVGGRKPEQWQQVFSSVQSLNAAELDSFPRDAFDIVVIDEFHHAAAASYRRILDHFQPVELLGLTATPERADGFDVRDLFGGRIASELRLWDALQADLLCPFHYFGIHDGTDLSGISWNRGAYDTTQLSNVFTGNDARARIVLKQLTEKVSDPSQMKALGFCVSVAHAEYMAKIFSAAGLPAVALSGKSQSQQRRQAILDLQTGMITTIFTADLFNEGVDLPDVDTLLFLRPTESATLFLQQLGRGLRRTKNKPVLTVLDFVGNQRAEFRYDKRFTAMTGIPRGHLGKHIEHEFPYLPAGTQIVLDKESTALVLDNVKKQLVSRWSELVAQLRSLGDLSLGRFLDHSGLELPDVIRGNKSWVRAREDAGLPVPSADGHDEKLLLRGHAFAHVDDSARLNVYRLLLSDECPTYQELEPAEQRFARMLLYSIWPKLDVSYEDGLRRLGADARARFEFDAILQVAAEQISHVPHELSGGLAGTGLFSHARYTREEILAALDYARPGRLPGNFREGVLWSEPWNTDAFLVTLNKSESEFAPTTMYDDYAISPTLFHWESQSSTTVKSPTGQRYLNQRASGTNVLIFSRSRRVWEYGKGGPYLLLGTAHYVQHEDEAPIAITWQLDRAMPSDHYRIATAVEAS